MAKFLYKTKNSIEPKGLQKVWFCAHPSDYAAYFERTAEQILSLVNCSIWYDGEPESPYQADAFAEDLSQMQLFVLPVTERFLLEDNRALSIELRIAAERDIPVLPI
jgi:hypothetical protein